ncbi:hypothetical protein ACWDSJ_25915 [Nocardia sp. NPDC003482]
MQPSTEDQKSPATRTAIRRINKRHNALPGRRDRRRASSRLRAAFAQDVVLRGLVRLLIVAMALAALVGGVKAHAAASHAAVPPIVMEGN